ncbi:MAG: hypothetical protein J3R72DRAFT_469837 [Linnemannia gamsii]|nr:MAG: hypothetical protein J3R72DRAFT_469837 [Linnemannia gamsii]
MDKESTHSNNLTNDTTRHEPQKVSLDSLPQEIQDMILPSLTLHDLAICVRVCQRWWTHFNPILWAELYLGRRPGQEADDIVEHGHEQERKSGSGDGVQRRRRAGIVDVLMKFGGAGGEGVEVWNEEAMGQVETLSLEDDETVEEEEEEEEEENEEDGDTENDDTSDESEEEEFDFRSPSSNDSGGKSTRVFVTATPPPVAELRIGGIETNAILALLRQSQHLTILKLGGEMMSMVHDLRFLILDAVPETIEQLELWDWRPASKKQEEYLSYYMYPTYKQPDLLPILSYLTRLALGRCVIKDDAALNRLLKRCPHLEALSLHDQEDWPSKAYQGLAVTIREFCKKVTGLFLVNCSLQSEEDLCLLMESCRESGLRDFGYPCPPECKSFFGEKAARALLVHCETLENCQIGGVPRPDVKFRTNGRPLTDPLHTSSTPQQSLNIQQKVYTQLGRLTQLRELVLGHHELNMNYMMFLDEMDTEGEYYDFDNPNQDVQGGYQYACLDMKLDSGMASLGTCKELRRCSVEAMAVGYFEDAEQDWVKGAWKMLDWRDYMTPSPTPFP